MKYLDKLKDPRWQRKRLKIMERDKWSCLNCGESTETLHVHHIKYFGNPWDTADNDLMTLCETCHKGEHGEKRDVLLNKMTQFINDNFTINELEHLAGLLYKLSRHKQLIDGVLEFALYNKGFVSFVENVWKNQPSPLKTSINVTKAGDYNILAVAIKK